MKTAVSWFTTGAAIFLLLCGCATSVETPIRKPKVCLAPQPVRVGILPPRIHPSLERENVAAEEPFYKELLDGRGRVVTSGSVSKDIGLELVSTLTQADIYQRVFTVENEEDARNCGADTLMTVTVWDYRAILLGSNEEYPLMAALSPLLSQYWLRWRTIEARLEWEVKLTSVTNGLTLYRNRLKRAYTSPVRSASGHHFTDKMLSFLQHRATPDFIGELFGLEMSSPPSKK